MNITTTVKHNLQTQKVLIGTHSPCIDGFVSALVAYAYASHFYKGIDHVEFMPLRHGHSYEPFLLAAQNRFVLLCDITPPKQVLAALDKRSRGYVILDHHASAEKQLKALPTGYYVPDKSGAQIMAEVLELSTFADATPSLPLIVDYVGDRDLWKFALPDSKVINAALSTRSIHYTDTASFVSAARNWYTYATLSKDEFIARATYEGNTILRFTDRVVSSVLETVVIGQILGRTEHVPIVNVQPQFVSEVLDALLSESDYPFVVGWYFEGRKYVYSIRSRHNVSAANIASAYGGGGHARAAGFSSIDQLVRTQDLERRRDDRLKQYLGIQS